MKRLILMMPLIASGCADFAFNSNLDKENFDEYFKPGSVQIYEQGQLADLNYLYLGTVEGESCQSDAKQPIPTPARPVPWPAAAWPTWAQRRHLRQVRRIQRHPGCLKQVICYGQALKVATEK
jgi:RcsF protein